MKMPGEVGHTSSELLRHLHPKTECHDVVTSVCVVSQSNAGSRRRSDRFILPKRTTEVEPSKKVLRSSMSPGR